MSKKHFRLILFINLLLLVIVYFASDIFYFLYISEKEHSFILNNKISYKIKSYLIRYKYNYLDSFEDKYILRTSNTEEVKDRFLSNINSSKQPIVLLGCSYTYGQNLSKEQSISGQLAKYTNRPIYNLAFIAAGIQHMIYILNSDKIKNSIKNPKYVIYTFIPDHTNRLYRGCGFSIIDYLYYKIRKNKLELNYKYSYIMRLPIPFIVNNFIYEKGIKSYEQKKNFLKQHILELYYQSCTNWKDSKFIIFVYDLSPEMKDITEELKSKEINIVILDELLKENNIIRDESFKLPKNIDKFQHPSAHAWEIIVPILADYINKDIDNNEKSK